MPYSVLKEVINSRIFKFFLGNHKQFAALLLKAEHSISIKSKCFTQHLVESFTSSVFNVCLIKSHIQLF